MTQVAIAEAVGVTQPTISKAIAKLHGRWRAEQITDTNLAIQIELERISNLEREYWSAWERSRENRAIRSTKQTKKPAPNGRGPGSEKTEAGLRTEARDGNPKFLEGVRWCVAKRIELLGLLPSQRPTGAWPPSSGDDALPAVDSRMGELLALLETARDRARACAIEGTVVGESTEAE
jgi:hypothetical protein